MDIGKCVIYYQKEIKRKVDDDDLTLLYLGKYLRIKTEVGGDLFRAEKREELVKLCSFNFRRSLREVVERFLIRVMHNSKKIKVELDGQEQHYMPNHVKHDKDCYTRYKFSAEWLYDVHIFEDYRREAWPLFRDDPDNDGHFCHDQKYLSCLYCAEGCQPGGSTWCEHVFLEYLLSDGWFCMGQYYISIPKERTISRRQPAFVVVINLKRNAIHQIFDSENTKSLTRKQDQKIMLIYLDLIGANRVPSLFSWCMKSVWDNKLPSKEMGAGVQLFKEYSMIEKIIRKHEYIFW